MFTLYLYLIMYFKKKAIKKQKQRTMIFHQSVLRNAKDNDIP